MPGALKARTAVSPDVWTIIGGGAPPTFLTPTITTFNNSGTWTKPAGLVYIDVEVQGGGGASGGAPASTTSNTSFGVSGAGGGYARKTLLASQLQATEVVTVGAGGTGVSGANGNVGVASQFGDGTSSFTPVAGGGGSGGTAGAAAANTAPRTILAVFGGIGTGGDVNFKGGPGGPIDHTTTGSIGGDTGGGYSYFGQGGNYGIEANGVAGVVPGSGGGGMRNSGAVAVKTGGNGAKGIVIVTEWTQQVAATGITEAAADVRYVALTGDSAIAGDLKVETVNSFNMALADDEAKTITFAGEARGLLAFSGNTGPAGNGLIMFRTGAAAQCILITSAGATVTCGVGTALTGTTGVDGHLTFRTNTANNVLYIENRTNGARGYAGLFLAMTGTGGGFTYTP